VGGEGNDSISGAKAGDDLWGGAGNDSIVGGDGFDFVRYDVAPSPVTVRFGSGTAVGEGADTLAGVEGVVGSSGGDTLNGGGGGESFFGESGADAISGGGGGDDLGGGAGNDGLSGGGGNDALRGGDGNDDMDGGTGTDSCVQGPGSGTRKNCETARVPAPVAPPSEPGGLRGLGSAPSAGFALVPLPGIAG